MPETSPDSNKRNLRNLILFLLPGILSAATVYTLWTLHPDIEYWKQLLVSGRKFLEAHPWALILSIVILPGIGVPSSPLLILFGIVMVPIYGTATACLLCVAAMACCTIWTYFLSVGPLRDFLRHYVLRNRALPEMTQRNALRLGFIVRITPGVPYALQNILLGVLGLPLRTYLLVSLPITSLYAVAFVATSGSIFEGNTGIALTGAMLLVVLILITRMLRSRNQDNAG
ncbi:MAG: TVP38/TMEM64 family protein [Coraliomargarita sp.]